MRADRRWHERDGIGHERDQRHARVSCGRSEHETVVGRRAMQVPRRADAEVGQERDRRAAPREGEAIRRFEIRLVGVERGHPDEPALARPWPTDDGADPRRKVHEIRPERLHPIAAIDEHLRPRRVVGTSARGRRANGHARARCSTTRGMSSWPSATGVDSAADRIARVQRGSNRGGTDASAGFAHGAAIASVVPNQAGRAAASGRGGMSVLRAASVGLAIGVSSTAAPVGAAPPRAVTSAVAVAATGAGAGGAARSRRPRNSAIRRSSSGEGSRRTRASMRSPHPTSDARSLRRAGAGSSRPRRPAPPDVLTSRARCSRGEPPACR